MAEIVLGIGSSHGPQLALPPNEWWRRRDWDMRFPELWYQGRVMRFDDLVEERSDEHLEAECTQEKFDARFDACQRAIANLADTIARVKPDVAVIVGDDQKECFLDDNMPSISVFWGETVDTVPLKPDGHGSGEFSLAPPEISRYPQVRTTNPCEPKLGQHIIESLISNGFDPGHSHGLPAGRDGEHAIGHAFSYVYRRLMRDDVVPNVPIFLNTYYPPNQPTLKRSFELGRAVRRAIESWDSDKTVALIASGGMTHFVIEEEQDRAFLAALETNDEEAITRQPLSLYNSGNSEMRNWVVLAGAMEGSNARMNTIDYVPCYRSEAGTGCAMAFAEWQPT
jgi:3-O-methylgallate 3,4-dioxygenase